MSTSQTHSLMDKPQLALEMLRSRISASLRFVCFPGDHDGHSSLDRFVSDERDLPIAAGLLCKLAGLLVQAYWFSLKKMKRQDEIPREVEYIASQIWAGHLDFSEGTAVSLLRHVCMSPDSSSLSQLVRHPYVFETWREMIQHRTTRYKQMTNLLASEDWYLQFSNLLDALPILELATCENDCFKFGELLPQPVPTFPFIFKSQQVDNPLFLSSFAPIEQRANVRFEDLYSDYSEEVSIEDHPLRDWFNQMRTTLGLERVQRGYVCLFGRDYENITDLAWAISSVEGKPLRRFVERFIRRHDRTSDQLDALEDVDLISLAIATDGPSDVLNRLLRVQPTLFETYLKYLERSKHGRVRAEEWKIRFEEQVQQKKDNIIPFLDSDRDLQEDVLEKIELETMCWFLIKAAGLRIDAPPDYVESIGMRAKMVRNLWANYRAGVIEKETVILNIAKIFERTLRFLICFYSGLQGYYLSYLEKPSDYDGHEKAMSIAAREALEGGGLQRATPGTLHMKFRELCNAMSHDHRETLEHLLGRNRICVIRDYESLVQKWFYPVNPTKHDLAKLFFDRDLPSLKRVAPKDVRTFVDNTVELLDFLRDGTSASKRLPRRESSGAIVGEPIYPMVVSFREQHRKKDGLSIYNYRVHFVDALSRDESQEIKILTSRDQLSNEQYYCIPGKTTIDWWLDPFLIRCGKFHGASNEIAQAAMEAE